MTEKSRPASSSRAAAAPGLFIEDRLKQRLPGWLYYPYKVAKEARRNEPELLTLRDMVRPGCTAIDVGSNRGYYSFALSRIAGRVEAFEPNPAVAAFARPKLGRNVRLHELALSDREGTAAFHVPRSAEGFGAHQLGSLLSYGPMWIVTCLRSGSQPSTASASTMSDSSRSTSRAPSSR